MTKNFMILKKPSPYYKIGSKKVVFFIGNQGEGVTLPTIKIRFQY